MVFDVLGALRETVDALTNPAEYREPRHGWTASRNRVPLPDHVVTLPGLLTQLGDLAYPGGRADTTGRAVPRSRPPGDARALVAYVDIHIAVTRWTVMLGLRLRDTIESSVRQLLGHAPTLGGGTQTELLDDARRWLRTCEDLTGWRTHDPELSAPCPHCGQRLLRVSLADRTARCAGCRSRWAEVEDEDTGSIGVLARHVQHHRRVAEEAAGRVWEAERVAKRARWSAAGCGA